jgi:hypothetical protein
MKKTTGTNSTASKKIKRKLEPQVRDYVRTCACGDRVLVSIKSHGYIKSLTVESNGYIKDETDSYLWTPNHMENMFKLGLPFIGDMSYKRLLKLGVYKQFNKVDMGIIARSPRWDNIPKLIVRSYRPKDVKMVYCWGCGTKLYMKLFKEIKHS